MAKSRTAPVPRRRRRCPLREDVARSHTAHLVDRDAGVIRGVKILGRESVNGRTYTPSALHEAVPLYEGAAVNVNHPRKATDPRASEDRFGRLINVHIGSDGDLYGDLEYLKTHPMAERVCEAAERMPEAFGLSHNAEGEVQSTPEGRDVVHRIIEVRSVDLVADPATTGGMFEHRQGKKPMKIKAFFERILKRQLVKGKAKRGLLRKLLAEASYMDATDMPAAGADTPPESGNPDGGGDDDDQNLADEDDPQAALTKGFRAAIMAVVDDDSMDAAAKAKKIGELVRTHEKLCAKADDDDEEDVEEDFGGGSGAAGGSYSDSGSLDMGSAESGKDFGEGVGCGADDKDKKGKMTPEQRVRQLERREKARDLIESANLSWDKAEERLEFLGLLLETRTEAAMGKLVEREKKAQSLAGQQTRRPRSGNTSGSTSLTEQQNGTHTLEGRYALLRS